MVGKEEADIGTKPQDPGKVVKATKTDNEIEPWDDRMAKLHSECGQNVSNNMKVATLYAMLPKYLQERVLDECAVNWDKTPEKEAGVLSAKVKGQIKNIAKIKRVTNGPKAMEADAVWRGSE